MNEVKEKELSEREMWLCNIEQHHHNVAPASHHLSSLVINSTGQGEQPTHSLTIFQVLKEVWPVLEY